MARGAAANLGGGLGKFTELRQRLLFVLGALIVYRIGCYIPVPGVNPQAMIQLMESQKGTIVDMFNMFSGGALQHFSLFALNVVPYISASIVVQLMTQILPSWKAMSKEGESGRRKITSTRAWARWAWRSSRPPASRWRCRAPGASTGIQVVYNPGPGSS
jgi:preprotein translocase subunit SecY